MTEKIRILFLSANPWTTSRILVDEEAREIFERLQEGPHRDKFELHKHAAIRPIDFQRLLMMYRPQIVHFSGHGSKRERIILGGTHGRGKEVERQGLVDLFVLYKHHVRLVLLNACFTRTQARSLSEVIDYSVGTGKGIGDKGGVAFAGAFYRALGFGRSVKEAFESAKAELGLTKMPRTKGIELFVRGGISEQNRFPIADSHPNGSAGNPWRFLSAPFVTHPSDCHPPQVGIASPYQDSFLRRSASEEADPGFETSDTSFFDHLIRYEEESYSQLAQMQVSLVRKESAVPACAFASFGDQRSQSPLTNLREATPTRAARPRPGKTEIEPRSLTSNSRNHIAMKVKQQRVVMVVATHSRASAKRATKPRRVDPEIQAQVRSVKAIGKRISRRQVENTRREASNRCGS